MTICERKCDKTDSSIANIVTNLGVKRNAEEFLQQLKSTAVALDKVQRDSSTTADAVDVRKQLETDLALDSRDTKQKFKKRIQQALTAHHI